MRKKSPDFYAEFVASKLKENEEELAEIRRAAAACVEMELEEDPGEDFRTGKPYGKPASIPIEGAAMRRICRLLINNSRAVCTWRKLHVDYPTFDNATLRLTTEDDDIVSLDPFSVCSETTAADPGCATHYKIAMPDACYKRFRASLSLRKLRRLQKFGSPEEEQEFIRARDAAECGYDSPADDEDSPWQPIDI